MWEGFQLHTGATFTPKKYFWYFRAIKNSNDNTGNGTCESPACSRVPQTTALLAYPDIQLRVISLWKSFYAYTNPFLSQFDPHSRLHRTVAVLGITYFASVKYSDISACHIFNMNFYSFSIKL